MAGRELAIVFLDDQMVGVNKPSGLVIHRSRTARDAWPVVRKLREQLADPEIVPVNRLDRGTSGAVVFGRSREAARALSLAFQDRLVEKTYLALVRGWPHDQGSIDSPVDGKPAFTAFTTLARVEREGLRLALLSVHPRTGVHHQIRRHLRRMGHPVLGDASHGSRRDNQQLQQLCRVKRLLLHARRLVLPHPLNGCRVEISAPLPGRLRGLFDWLGVDQSVLQGL